MALTNADMINAILGVPGYEKKAEELKRLAQGKPAPKKDRPKRGRPKSR